MSEPADEALRAALTDWARTYGFGGRAFISGTYKDIADALLALPEMAALLADAERVKRVRDLAEEWDEYPASPEAACAFELQHVLGRRKP